jgi:hypothetical protein
MQKWEYMRVFVFNGKVLKINDNLFGFTPNEKLDPFLKRMGLEGWELINIHTSPEEDIYFFKRPIPENPT